MLRKYSINFVHQINRGLIEAYRRVVGRGPADLEQLALARKAQTGVFFTDHLAAFRRAHRFSPCDKARGTVAPAGPRKYSYRLPLPTGRSWREAL